MCYACLRMFTPKSKNVGGAPTALYHNVHGRFEHGSTHHHMPDSTALRNELEIKLLFLYIYTDFFQNQLSQFTAAAAEMNQQFCS